MSSVVCAIDSISSSFLLQNHEFKVLLSFSILFSFFFQSFWFATCIRIIFNVMLWVILIYSISFTMRHSAPNFTKQNSTCGLFARLFSRALSLCHHTLIRRSVFNPIQLKPIIHLHIAITWINSNKILITIHILYLQLQQFNVAFVEDCEISCFHFASSALTPSPWCLAYIQRECINCHLL